LTVLVSQLAGKEKAITVQQALAIIFDHLYNDLHNRGREDILVFCTEVSIFTPAVIDEEILVAIAHHIVEVCFHWRWR
jgi:hypothetical protein